MTVQMFVSLVESNISLQNVLIALAIILIVRTVFKVGAKRQTQKREFAGYYDSRGRYRKAVNRKAGSGSNGSAWHSGSYDGRR